MPGQGQQTLRCWCIYDFRRLLIYPPKGEKGDGKNSFFFIIFLPEFFLSKPVTFFVHQQIYTV